MIECFAMKLTDVKTRLDLPRYLNARGLTGQGVEVGVYQGEFSHHILKHWNGKKLYLVDSWRKLPRREYNDASNVDQTGHFFNMGVAMRKVARFGARAAIIRELSVEASVLFEDRSLDFVFIDANHRFGAVTADLKAWYPKIRRGGLLGGHDFLNSPRKKNHLSDFGVRSAATRWASRHRLKIHSNEVEKFPSWFVEV